jgi:hypothetical protein
MRSLLVFLCATTLAAAAVTAQEGGVSIRIDPAQQRPEVRQLPRDVADEVIRFFNSPGTVRFSGITRIPAARGIDGDVAVLGGPVTIAGRISGSLTVINGDLVLEHGAVIGGEVLVVGGVIEGATRASIAGEARSYPSVLRYRRAGDELTYAPEREALRRWRRPATDSRTNFDVGLDGTYNRVEGVPIVVGPGINLRVNEGTRFQGDARLILRTGENFSLDPGRFGYRARGELVVGQRTSNVGFGIRAFDQITSVEPWPLRDYEAGWAAFLLRNDYRDWYRRQGWAVYAAIRPSRAATLTIEGREQDVFSKAENRPWTLFNGARTWRTNPAVTDGQYRSLVASLRLDTRNDRREPSSGILVNAEFEASEGRNISGMIDPNIVCITAPCVPASYTDGRLTYQRAWLDARLYTRLTPSGRLNLRLVGGGKMGGDDLPLQNRVSLGFPDPLPGYSFRYMSCGGERFAGQPALCDRAIVAQAELRTHMGFDFGPDWANMWGDDAEDRYEPFHVTGPDVVLFADAGYAWSVGSGPGALAADRFPALHLWQPDVGLGLDLGPIGAYVSKALGPYHGPVTFTLRMGRRF